MPLPDERGAGVAQAWPERHRSVERVGRLRHGLFCVAVGRTGKDATLVALKLANAAFFLQRLPHPGFQFGGRDHSLDARLRPTRWAIRVGMTIERLDVEFNLVANLEIRQPPGLEVKPATALDAAGKTLRLGRRHGVEFNLLRSAAFGKGSAARIEEARRRRAVCFGQRQRAPRAFVHSVAQLGAAQTGRGAAGIGNANAAAHRHRNTLDLKVLCRPVIAYRGEMFGQQGDLRQRLRHDLQRATWRIQVLKAVPIAHANPISRLCGFERKHSFRPGAIRPKFERDTSQHRLARRRGTWRRGCSAGCLTDKVKRCLGDRLLCLHGDADQRPRHAYHITVRLFLLKGLAVRP